MRFSDYPFLKYLPIFIGGILLAQNSSFLAFELSAIVLSVLFLGYLILLNLAKSRTRLVILSSFGYLSIFFLGVFLANQAKMQDSNSNISESFDAYIGEVQSYDAEKPNSFENLLKLKAVKRGQIWEQETATVLIYHQAIEPLIPGQILLVQKSPDQIAAPKNPAEFDYRNYLARRGIQYRQFIGSDFMLLDSFPKLSNDFILIRFRNRLVKLIEDKIPDVASQQIALAILLGQKQSLDRDLRDGYVQAGVMHILAVSGLHVGIIYALLLGLMKPLKLPKKWSQRYLILVVLLIWIYALLTGMSPSVVRAATMFSLLSMGQMRDRKPSVFNILAFSAMLMLVVDPNVLYDVGFQLSYLAVAGIVLIQPLILRWWLPTNQILEYFWQLTAVSLAAQLATFPLSIFYFHLFPTYFLVGNLLIIPLAFLIMQVGVPLLILGWVPLLGDMLGYVLSKLIWIQNQIISWISLLPFGKLDRLTMDWFGMIFFWIVLLIWASWEMGNKKKLIYLFYSLSFVWACLTLSKELFGNSSSLIIYQGKNGQAFDYRVENQLFSWNPGLEPEELTYLVDPNRIATHSPQIPNSLIGIPIQPNSVRLFPAPVILNHETSEITFEDKIPRVTEKWVGGKWVKIKGEETLSLGETAFRILF